MASDDFRYEPVPICLWQRIGPTLGDDEWRVTTTEEDSFALSAQWRTWAGPVQVFRKVYDHDDATAAPTEAKENET